MEIKETDAKQVFEIYELRKFLATWMISQRIRVHSQYPAGYRQASSGSWLSVVGLLVMRSLGIGTSSSHRGFVAEFGLVGFW